jgi:hypothetical protein
MPGTSFESDDPDFDPQDQAEVFDESMTVGGEGDVSLADDSPVSPAEDMRTFEELPDVYDVTTRVGDRDEDDGVALDADEFDPEAFDEEALEEDDELAYGAARDEPEIGSLSAEPAAEDDSAQPSPSEIEGLEEVRDGDEVSGGEDDFSNFSAHDVSDEDLRRMGYAEQRQGQTRARPDGR